MKNASLRDAEFLDRENLEAELTRVFEKCHDCRRCLPLCPAFPSLFEAIDRHQQEASELTASETREVVDLCYQCKLCYNHCPYHPTHEWEIDFPKLMTRAKLVQAQEDGIPLAERIVRAEALEAEVEVYNELLPRDHELSATLMIEIPSQTSIRPQLDRLIGIDEHVHLDIGGESIRAGFDDKQFQVDRISAVQFIRFELGPELANRFREPGIPVALRVDHPNYTGKTVIEGEARISLTADLG